MIYYICTQLIIVLVRLEIGFQIAAVWAFGGLRNTNCPWAGSRQQECTRMKATCAIGSRLVSCRFPGQSDEPNIINLANAKFASFRRSSKRSQPQNADPPAPKPSTNSFFADLSSSYHPINKYIPNHALHRCRHPRRRSRRLRPRAAGRPPLHQPQHGRHPQEGHRTGRPRPLCRRPVRQPGPPHRQG